MSYAVISEGLRGHDDVKGGNGIMYICDVYSLRSLYSSKTVCCIERGVISEKADGVFGRVVPMSGHVGTEVTRDLRTVNRIRSGDAGVSGSRLSHPLYPCLEREPGPEIPCSSCRVVRDLDFFAVTVI